MIIIETPIFAKAIQSLMPEDDYRQLQSALVIRPDMGDLIPGSGGLRKLRWRISGRGKRAGVRLYTTGQLLAKSSGCFWRMPRQRKKT